MFFCHWINFVINNFVEIFIIISFVGKESAFNSLHTFVKVSQSILLKYSFDSTKSIWIQFKPKDLFRKENNHRKQKSQSIPNCDTFGWYENHTANCNRPKTACSSSYTIHIVKKKRRWGRKLWALFERFSIQIKSKEIQRFIIESVSISSSS